MYSHLMVPVDGSALSSTNVEEAVQIALALDAQITFFHATADLGATGDGALLRTIDPKAFSGIAVGETHSILAKAAASARARGVPCELLSQTCDRPAEAIVEAARRQGCDLIVMASRGVRGMASWLHSSQTERVFRHSPIALLVTRSAANDPPKASERALAIIHDEHLSIAAVVLGLKDLVQQGRVAGQSLDVASMLAMLSYLQEFPLRLHHPKEEIYLHRKLRERDPDCDALLREVEAQHVTEHALVDETLARLTAAEAGEPGAADALTSTVLVLAEAVWQHIGLEERSVLPKARQYLQEVDWEEMAAAFEANDDPGFGALPTEEFRRLFTGIANLLPAGSHRGKSALI